MPWTVLESKRNRGAIETAISDWETSESPTSVDQLSVTPLGPDRVAIQVVYTA